MINKTFSALIVLFTLFLWGCDFPHSISGKVTIDGVGVPGVVVTLTGVEKEVAVTDDSGEYNLEGLDLGDYTVSVERAGYTFSPESQAVTIAKGEESFGGEIAVTGIDFTGSGGDNGTTVSIAADYFYTYNEDGNVATIEQDDYKDGVVDAVAYYTYDSSGSLNKIESDLNNDGEIDDVLYYTYDSEGIRTSSELDQNQDTIVEAVYYFSYDASGNLTLVGEDLNNDGSIDASVYSTYSGNGDLSKVEWDDDNDGIKDAVSNYFYDDAGALSMVARDDNYDGVVETEYLFLYLEGQLNRIERDDGGDGAIDAASNFIYDSIGNLVTVEQDDSFFKTISTSLTMSEMELL